MSDRNRSASEGEASTDATETTPRPVGRMVAKTRAHRVEGDVAENFGEVSVVSDDCRCEASLEEMAFEAVPLVEPPGVQPVQVVHTARKGWVGRFDHEVEMVGHQAVRECSPRASASRSVKDPKEAVAISIVEEERLPPVSASCDVIGPAGQLDPGRSRHGAESTGDSKRSRGPAQYRDTLGPGARHVFVPGTGKWRFGTCLAAFPQKH